MNDQQINEMLDTLGIPYEYHHFNDDVNPPFLLYVEEPQKNIIADGIIYASIRNLTFELYSDKKDYKLINKAMKMFSDHDIRFQSEEDWIEKEDMFEFAFMVQI